MFLSAEMRSGINRIRDYLYGGGYPDPLLNAEALAFPFFFYLIEGIDADNAAQAKGLRREHRSVFAGDWQLRKSLNAPAKGVETVPADPEHNVAYIRLCKRRGETETLRISDELNVHMAPDGTVYGIDLLNANEQLASADSRRLVVVDELDGRRRQLTLTQAHQSHEIHPSVYICRPVADNVSCKAS